MGQRLDLGQTDKDVILAEAGICMLCGCQMFTVYKLLREYASISSLKDATAHVHIHSYPSNVFPHHGQLQVLEAKIHVLVIHNV